MSGKPLRLGRFCTEALLGQGPTTETYRARLSEPKGDDRRFIITLLRDRALPLAAQSAARFVEAARQLAGLDQAGCVRVVELGEGPGPIYAVHDFKVGVNLAQLRQQAVPKGSMDPRLVGVLARKLAERLAVLHGRSQAPRLHGALSPGNVLVTPDGDVLLLDCGLAEAVRPRGDEFVGRWLFAAPEQVAGGVAVPASDLYSIGALIHFLFFGTAAFLGFDRGRADGPDRGGAADGGWHASLAARLDGAAPGQRCQPAPQVRGGGCSFDFGGHVGGGNQSRQPWLLWRWRVGQVGRHDFRARPGQHAQPELARIRGRREEDPAGSEPIVPFSLDDTLTEDERPRAARARGTEKEPVVPFSLDTHATESEEDEPDRPDHRLSPISADDPDVGVVYDEDDEEQEQVVVGKDGKVKRRRRRRIRIPVWVRSELARRMARLALIPLMALTLVAIGAGVLFYREWSTTRQASARRNAEIVADAEKRAQARQMAKLPETPILPAGHLEVKTTPAGATVWVDGVQKDKTPLTVITSPGAHRLVVTLPGYRMLRDVVDTGKGILWEREMFVATRIDDGQVPVTVTCLSEKKFPVFVDGKDSGELCPVSDLRIDPGRHSIGVFVIPQNRIWAFDREIQANRPHRVQFNY